MVQTDVSNSNLFNKDENNNNSNINNELKKENEKLIEEIKKLKSIEEKRKNCIYRFSENMVKFST